MSRGWHIAVVEDDAGMRRAVERVLSAAGFESIAFDSSEALLASTVVSHMSCLVADLQLPGISGFELKSALARAGNRAPVIFITAHDEASVREQAMASGAAAYLVKPFDGRRLVDAIAAAMSGSPQGFSDGISNSA